MTIEIKAEDYCGVELSVLIKTRELTNAADVHKFFERRTI
jgi:hypothetical protein